MGVTEPEPDATELSARNKESEDVTLLSERDREAVVSIEEDDVTRFSVRAGGRGEADVIGADAEAAHADLGVTDSADVDTADHTRLSRRSGEGPPVPRSARSGATLSPLPPGVLGGAAAERGSFGQPVEEYEARELPEVPIAAPPVASAAPAPALQTPDPGQVRDRREAARHRRLITAAVVVGVTAALITAAIFGIVALIRG